MKIQKSFIMEEEAKGTRSGSDRVRGEEGETDHGGKVMFLFSFISHRGQTHWVHTVCI